MKSVLSKVGFAFFDNYAYLFSHVPGSSWKKLRLVIPKEAKSILDVGCADGDMMTITGEGARHFLVGVDIFLPYLVRAKNRHTHSELVLCDSMYLPFREKSFDVVLCLEVIEHFESKKEGLSVLSQLESMARDCVIVSTPVGLTKQEGYAGNQNQEHKIGWVPREMENLGYSVDLIGIRETTFVEFVKTSFLKTASRAVAKQSLEGTIAMIYSMKLIDLILRTPYYLLGSVLKHLSRNFSGHMFCTKVVMRNGGGI